MRTSPSMPVQGNNSRARRRHRRQKLQPHVLGVENLVVDVAYPPCQEMKVQRVRCISELCGVEASPGLRVLFFLKLDWTISVFLEKRAQVVSEVLRVCSLRPLARSEAACSAI